MKIVAPDYYRDFHCKADKCKNTCCAGWEIDIDEDTFEYYKSLDGSLSEKLKNSVSSDGTPHFILQGKDERCPMLTDSGLCEIICAYGETALCQICADHPRFRNYYSDRTEMGLGLCCEAAAELILGKKDKTRLITISDDGANEPTDNRERKLFKLRNGILEILQSRQFPVADRMNQVLLSNGIEDKRSLKELIELFLSLERLDEKWTECLLNPKEAEIAPGLSFSQSEQTMAEQFAVYLIFRHTPYLDSENALLSVNAMYRIFESLCLIEIGESGYLDLSEAAEIARLLSSEIEYSDENTEILFGS
ncbi:MAG: flagellin lysine-N-methylase [Acutalibacteraceae bacterium]